ncbi:preprotein translocase subunit YajC [Nakamurella sp. GG22]
MEQMLLPILMFAGLGGLMYFSMKKQKRVAAATKQMHDSLVPGARVMTTSGLHGTVTAIADDTIELEIAPGLRTTWVRAAVREIIVPGQTDDYELVDSSDDPDVIDAEDLDPTDTTVTDRKSKDLN